MDCVRLEAKLLYVIMCEALSSCINARLPVLLSNTFYRSLYLNSRFWDVIPVTH